MCARGVRPVTPKELRTNAEDDRPSSVPPLPCSSHCADDPAPERDSLLPRALALVAKGVPLLEDPSDDADEDAAVEGLLAEVGQHNL